MKDQQSCISVFEVYLFHAWAHGRFIRPVKQNQLSFSSTEINKPLPAPIQCLVDEIQVQKTILVVATDQMPDHS